MKIKGAPRNYFVGIINCLAQIEMTNRNKTDGFIKD